MRTWIDAQMIELMGEADATLASFVLDLLRAREGADAATSKLKPLLDDDAEQFVRDLFDRVHALVGEEGSK